MVALLLVAFGRPLWISRADTSLWASRPTWKTNQAALAAARDILDRYDGSGPILANVEIMRSIALVTVHPKTVTPNRFYARLLPEPRRRIRQRLALARFVMDPKRKPSAQEFSRALSDLRVGLVCLADTRTVDIREVEASGPYREAFRVRDQVCLERK